MSSSSPLDVSAVVSMFNGELSKLMVRFFSVIHDKHEDISIEELRTMFEGVSGIDAKTEEPKKVKRVAKKSEEEAKCEAIVASGEHAGQVCGAGISPQSITHKYCNRHLRQEKGKLPKKEKKEEELPQKEEKKETEEEKKEIKEEKKETEEQKEEKKDTEELHNLIQTVLEVQRPSTPVSPLEQKPKVDDEKIASKKSKVVRIKTNSNGNRILEIEGCKLVMNKDDKICGKEDSAGKIVPLSQEDKEMCKKKKIQLAK
jgi:hypothetical protein